MSNQNNNISNYSTTNTSTSHKSTLVAVEQYMSIYVPFVLTTLGIVGNILSILIFLSPRYRRQSSHFYLLSLALSDLCFLIINLIEDTFRNHNELYHSRINILDRSSPIICILVEYARNTTRLLSSWIIVSFTIERLLVVFHPLKRAIICRRKIARCVVSILFFLSLLININVPFHYGIINLPNSLGKEDTICDILPKYHPIYMRFAISTMITVYLVPMCLIGAVNMLICCKLWRKSLLTEKDENKTCERREKKLVKPRRLFYLSDILSCLHPSSSSSTQYQSVEPPTENNATQINNRLLHDETRTHSTLLSKQSSSTNIKNYIQSRTNRVTLTLLLVSCSFLLLNSPYCAVWIANYVHGFRNATLRSIKEITELFMLTNFCINFLLYCVSGKVFRAELMYLLRCQWKELYNRNEGERTGYRKTQQKTNIQLQQTKFKGNSTKYTTPYSTSDRSRNLNQQNI